MEEGNKKEAYSPPTRMTCLMWIAILVVIPLFARACQIVVSWIQGP